MLHRLLRLDKEIDDYLQNRRFLYLTLIINGEFL